jgi:glycosyltransferase involved in cell wall biosynthesis
MVAPVPAPAHPELSVIVPARNEEASLGACLDSLVNQSGLQYEIIVVDDGSTDRTRQVAQSYSQVAVISPGLLPPGATGKNNALVAGAHHAQGNWLLFTDADTVHRPDSLLRSLTEARNRQVDLLSYSPEQDVQTFWEKATMPVIFSELAAWYRPSEVSDPQSPAAAANGQFILVRRAAYDAVGGHVAIASDLLEDVALARRFKSAGYKIFFRYGADILRTRMYRTFAAMREGWTKNLALLFSHPLRLALARLQEFVVVLAGFLFSIWAALDRHFGLAGVSAALTCVLCGLLWRRVARAHFPWTANILAFVGLPMFAYLLLRSKVFHRAGKVSWKGRTYIDGSAFESAPAQQQTGASVERVKPIA